MSSLPSIPFAMFYTQTLEDPLGSRGLRFELTKSQ